MLLEYIRRQRRTGLFLASCAAVFAAVVALYGYPAAAVGYAALLCAALGLAVFAAGYAGFARRHRELRRLLDAVNETVLPLPPARGMLEEDYQALLRAVCDHRARLLARSCWRITPSGRTRSKRPSRRGGCCSSPAGRRIGRRWRRSF